MPQINLKYGKSTVPFVYDAERFQLVGDAGEAPALTDVEIGARLDAPIGSPPLEEIVNAGETVLFVVPDATRQTACGQIINLLVRRLIASGTMPFEMAIMFATGIHRPVTEAEKSEILTPFIYQRIKNFDHNARDLAAIVRVGETPSGIPVDFNRALTEYDHIVLIGGVSFHYFAGFTGGRKLICPGLASSRTISATHKIAFDCETKSRRMNVGAGILSGNPVHEAFVEVASHAKPSFAVSTITDERGAATDVFCGDWLSSHAAACEFYAARHTIEIAGKRELVVASCGGFPFDANLIQAHKTLDAAARLCADGGTIALLAECADGTGRADFINWFAAGSSDEVAEKLCENYQVNGQTAWSLLKKTEKFNVVIITSLSAEETRPMRLNKIQSLDELAAKSEKSGYILPNGAKYAVR